MTSLKLSLCLHAVVLISSVTCQQNYFAQPDQYNPYNNYGGGYYQPRGSFYNQQPYGAYNNNPVNPEIIDADGFGQTQQQLGWKPNINRNLPSQLNYPQYQQPIPQPAANPKIIDVDSFPSQQYLPLYQQAVAKPEIIDVTGNQNFPSQQYYPQYQQPIQQNIVKPEVIDVSGNQNFPSQQYYPQYQQPIQQNIVKAEIIDLSDTHQYLPQTIAQPAAQPHLINTSSQNLPYYYQQFFEQYQKLLAQQYPQYPQFYTNLTKPRNASSTATPQETAPRLTSNYNPVRQYGSSTYEVITSKPIVTTFTETKPITSRIHRVFTSNSHHEPIVRVYYNGEDVTDGAKNSTAAVNKEKVTQAIADAQVSVSNAMKEEKSEKTEEEKSDEVEEDEDEDEEPSPINSWFG